MDVSLSKLLEIAKDREAWRPVVYWVAKNGIWEQGNKNAETKVCYQQEK